MGFESHLERKGGDFCGTVRGGVVVEFGCSKEFRPFLGVIGAEDSEIHRSRFLGWLIWFAHLFEGGRRSKGKHHSEVIVQVPEQMQR